MSQQIYIDTDGIERAIDSHVFLGAHTVIRVLKEHRYRLEGERPTKRELFAAMAMQGLFGNPNVIASLADVTQSPFYMSRLRAACVHEAEALLAELAKPQSDGEES